MNILNEIKNTSYIRIKNTYIICYNHLYMLIRQRNFNITIKYEFKRKQKDK